MESEFVKIRVLTHRKRKTVGVRCSWVVDVGETVPSFALMTITQTTLAFVVPYMLTK